MFWLPPMPSVRKRASTVQLVLAGLKRFVNSTRESSAAFPLNSAAVPPSSVSPGIPKVGLFLKDWGHEIRLRE
jgi:hypothetical protein